MSIDACYIKDWAPGLIGGHAVTIGDRSTTRINTGGKGPAMERCATCKFWCANDGLVGWEGQSAGMRECKRARERWVIMDEANAGQKYPDDNDNAEEAWGQRRVDALRQAKLYVQDGSEYHAELVTAPDFGCVLHEPA